MDAFRAVCRARLPSSEVNSSEVNSSEGAELRARAMQAILLKFDSEQMNQLAVLLTPQARYVPNP